MTSFKAMTVAARGLVKEIGITSKDRYLSYLPLSHGMERWTGEIIPLYSGMLVFFAESIKTFVNDLNRAKPTLFLSVPRLWTKFQAGVFQKMSEDTLNVLLQIPLVNILIRKKIVAGLGLECVRLAASGSAPIPSELLEWYRALGLELLEGYGMTENFNYSHMSRTGRSRAGYVGQTYDDVQCRIAADGEIQINTPAKMMGCFKNPEATKASITDDGWVRTGDKGEIDEEGRLKITGRIKEIFKTSKGKYVAPAPIENLFVAHSMVEMACVDGRGQPQPHAILQLTEGTKAKARNDGEYRQEITKALMSHLEKNVNPALDAHERLDFVVVVSDAWLPENGFLTPTQKIKRAKIEEEYDSEIAGWYKQAQKIVWHGSWLI
jgi:long-chain acyl-CoA synthetase